MSQQGRDRRRGLENRLHASEGTILSTECVGTAPNGDFGGSAISGGTTLSKSPLPGHPGIIAQKSHATNPNSGHSWSLSPEVLILNGARDVWAEFVLRFPTLGGVTSYIGFEDVFTATNPTDGAVFRLSGGVLDAVSYSGGSAIESSANSYAPELDTWYTMLIEIFDGAKFSLYNESGALLWSAVLSELSENPTGIGIITTLSSGGALELVWIDRIRARVR